MRCDMTWALLCDRKPCVPCTEMVAEARERMTTGGVKVPYYLEERDGYRLLGIVQVGGGAFFHAAR